MANRKTRKIKNSVSIQQNGVSSDKTENKNSSIQTITTETDYYRPIILAIEQSSEGDFIFIEANTPVDRKKIPEKIKNYGLKNVIYYININNDLPSSLPLHKSIPKWLREKNIIENKIVIALDGFEGIFRDKENAKEWLQTFNLSREALANVKAILIFLIPAFGIDLIRQYSPDIWSWRAFHFQLPLRDEFRETKLITSFDLAGYRYTEDNPEKRESRIKVLSGLLEDELKLHGSIEAVWRNILSPLAYELSTSARFNDALRILSKAEQLFNSSVKTIELVKYYNLLGSIYFCLGNLEKAEEYFNLTLNISKELYGKDDPNVAIGLLNLGVVLMDKGDSEKALEYYNQALEIDEKVYGKEHPVVSRVLSNIAGVLWKKGDLDNALDYMKRVLKIDEKFFGQYHPEVAGYLNNIGLVLRDKGDLDGALDYMKKGLEINEKFLGQDHPEVATILEGIGSVLKMKGDLDKARSFFKQAFLIFVDVFGIEHYKSINSLKNYINCGGHSEELLKLIKKSKKLTS